MNNLLKKLEKQPTKTVTRQDAVNVRDHLMLTLAYNNALRASNLMYLTVKDIKKETKCDDIELAYVIKSKKYKVSFIYGDKIVLVTKLC